MYPSPFRVLIQVSLRFVQDSLIIVGFTKVTSSAIFLQDRFQIVSVPRATSQPQPRFHFFKDMFQSLEQHLSPGQTTFLISFLSPRNVLIFTNSHIVLFLSFISLNATWATFPSRQSIIQSFPYRVDSQIFNSHQLSSFHWSPW